MKTTFERTCKEIEVRPGMKDLLRAFNQVPTDQRQEAVKRAVEAMKLCKTDK